jgi:hypothetical protein
MECDWWRKEGIVELALLSKIDEHTRIKLFEWLVIVVMYSCRRPIVFLLRVIIGIFEMSEMTCRAYRGFSIPGFNSWSSKTSQIICHIYVLMD